MALQLRKMRDQSLNSFDRHYGCIMDADAHGLDDHDGPIARYYVPLVGSDFIICQAHVAAFNAGIPAYPWEAELTAPVARPVPVS